MSKMLGQTQELHAGFTFICLKMFSCLCPGIDFVSHLCNICIIPEKVRGSAICAECGKRRVVFSPKRLNTEQELALIQVQEDIVYTCGGTLFTTGPYSDTLVVRTGINCASLIETQYYVAAALPICIHCGDNEVLDKNHPQIKQSEQEWGIVRPICSSCMNEGKKIITRNAMKTGKKIRK